MIRQARTYRALSAAGVLAAAVIAVCANVLVARFYQRWDWTSRGLYTLSPATVETLQGLDQPLDVVVFLGRGDPLTVSVRHMLTAYSARTPQLAVRFVDPDREPAEFLALQQKYGILAGKTDDGRLVTDAAVVVASRARHWFITADEMVSFDANDGGARPRLEQALTSALRNVLERDKPVLCFTTGHQELNIESGGPTGLAELRYRLEKNNYEVRPVELGATARLSALDDCRVAVVAGPGRPFSARAAEHLAGYLQRGGSLLLLLDPVLGEDDRIDSSGLDPVVSLAGIELGQDFVVERDPAMRLSTGVGEAYFATPREHDVTRGMVQGEAVMFRPVINVAQSVRATPAGSPTSLIVTTDQAFSLRDMGPFRHQGTVPDVEQAHDRGPFSLAMAVELSKPEGSEAPHGPRLVAVGTANLAWSRNWQGPTTLGNRMFVESAISWLAAQPALVSVPEKPAAEVGLSLTEESIGEVFRYVLIYMPGSSVALGLFVILRRRSQERRSRKRPTKSPEPRSGDRSSTSRRPNDDESAAESDHSSPSDEPSSDELEQQEGE